MTTVENEGYFTKRNIFLIVITACFLPILFVIQTPFVITPLPLPASTNRINSESVGSELNVIRTSPDKFGSKRKTKTIVITSDGFRGENDTVQLRNGTSEGLVSQIGLINNSGMIFVMLRVGWVDVSTYSKTLRPDTSLDRTPR